MEELEDEIDELNIKMDTLQQVMIFAPVYSRLVSEYTLYVYIVIHDCICYILVENTFRVKSTIASCTASKGVRWS